MNLLENFIMFVGGFFLVFIIIYLFNLYKYKKNKKDIMEIYYLQKKFSLKLNRKDVKKLLIPISIIDAFIISFVWIFVSMINIKNLWKFIFGFVLIFALIYALFELLGRHLKKKEN